MSNIERYGGNPPLNRAERRAQQVVRDVALTIEVEQVRLHAVATATELGMMRYVQVQRLQNDPGKLCPDAAEGLTTLATNALFNMTNSLQQFAHEVGQ
jgi:hypothetical protein